MLFDLVPLDVVDAGVEEFGLEGRGRLYILQWAEVEAVGDESVSFGQCGQNVICESVFGLVREDEPMK